MVNALYLLAIGLEKDAGTIMTSRYNGKVSEKGGEKPGKVFLFIRNVNLEDLMVRAVTTIFSP